MWKYLEQNNNKQDFHKNTQEETYQDSKHVLRSRLRKLNSPHKGGLAILIVIQLVAQLMLHNLLVMSLLNMVNFYIPIPV